MRTRLWLGILTLVACDGGGGDEQGATATAAPDDRVECALSGSDRFAADCAIERTEGATTLTIRHPDGGFRRLQVSGDGFVTADGAASAVVRALADGRNEVAVENDRYRLPAVKGR